MGRFLSADDGRPLVGFNPRATSASTSLGADRESIARELFGKPAAGLTPEQMTEVNTRLTQRTSDIAGAREAGRGAAKRRSAEHYRMAGRKSGEVRRLKKQLK
jgi:hypothetical protein